MNSNCPVRRFLLALGLSLSLCQPSSWTQTSGALSGKLVEIQKRADHGYTREQMELADAYMSGHGVQRDPAMAAYWYEKAAKNGDPFAEHQIGYLYSAGLGVQRDLVRAVHWYQLAAASGVSIARVNLGVMYLNGRGVQKDIARAKELFRQAAEQGEGVAATYLGVLEFTGLGGPSNPEAAKKCFEQGVKLHDPIAAFELAVFYSKYDSHKHDISEVIELLRRSSEKGYVPAKYTLGAILLNHPQLARSQDETMNLLQEALNAGDWRAANALGDCAAGGYCATKDSVRAFYFYKLAELEGGTQAQQIVAPKVASLALSEQQQAEAAEQAKAWIEQHHSPLMFVLKAEGTIPTFRDLSAPVWADPVK